MDKALDLEEDQIFTGSKSPQIEPTMQSLFSNMQNPDMAYGLQQFDGM